MGNNNKATNNYATALGSNNTASGLRGTAVGENNTASGTDAVAMGQASTASGDYSTAMGNNASTNGKNGSVCIADNSGSTLSNDGSNQMMMRFAGGYKLFSADASVGVQVAPGGNSWSTISDRRKKENFVPVNGEAFLDKIDGFDLTSWNYKGQDAKTFRHYGPMAQDFFAAFGRDSYGTSGNDTTICQADMEGVSFVMIQALEKRTKDQQQEIDQLKAENAALKAQSGQVVDLAKRLEAVEASLDANSKSQSSNSKMQVADSK
jgi:hypothetical protein